MNSLDRVRKIIKFIEEYKLKIRIKLNSTDNPTNWCLSLREISHGYLDFGLEPVTLKEIEYIDLDCIVVTRVGRLVPDKVINKEQVIQEHLINNEIDFLCLGNGILRIEI